MRFLSPLPKQELRTDFEQARSLGQVRLGERFVHILKFSGTRSLPYHQISRAWVRQEEVNASLCCGRANFDQFYLMIQGQDGLLLRGQVPHKQAGLDCLDRIRAKAPGVLIGPPGRP